VRFRTGILENKAEKKLYTADHGTHAHPGVLFNIPKVPSDIVCAQRPAAPNKMAVQNNKKPQYNSETWKKC